MYVAKGLDAALATGSGGVYNAGMEYGCCVAGMDGGGYMCGISTWVDGMGVTPVSPGRGGEGRGSGRELSARGRTDVVSLPPARPCSAGGMATKKA